ncbi:MAG TPA: RluA family pseudouridine synthase, partial [Anaerolineaceae bacterium]|nr:RluA family pseudouridine synthase [Anaerolineaceae bacterium]
DKFIAQSEPDVSRVQFQQLIAEGGVCVNGVVQQKPAFKLEPGSVVTYSLPTTEETHLLHQAIAVDVIYVDENVIVVNKPAGMVVHPGAGNTQDTLVNAILHRWPDIARVGEEGRPGVVHRLDKETSGVLILARNETAYNWLVRQFKSRKTKKTYLALVDGEPPTPTGRVETAIGRDEKNRQRMAVVYGDKGKNAVTEYHTLERYADHTLLEVQPLTGRTHQIRVHMAFLGCPVTGDRIYGRRKKSLDIPRFFLHAHKLTIKLPGEEEPTEFTAPLAADLKEILTTLEKE